MLTTDEQFLALKTAILADTDPDVVAAASARNDTELTRLYNLPSTTYIYRSNVTKSECQDSTSSEGTTWNWSAYIARSVQELMAWDGLFEKGHINATKSNERAAVADIFSGSTNSAPAQRTHLAAIAKRLATKAEAVFAVGTGTLVSPAITSVEGTLTIDDVGRAMNMAG